MSRAEQREEKRGGFKNLNWKDHRAEQEHKLDWIDWHYRRKKIKTILFGACATGFEVREARNRGYEAWGCEMSDYAIKHVDKRVRKFVYQTDLRDLSKFKDDAFDLVAVFDAIHIVPEESREHAYREICRVAKKGVMLRTRVKHLSYEPGYDDTYWGYG